MKSTEATEPTRLLAALNNEIDGFFGLDKFGLTHHDKEACIRLCTEQPSQRGAELILRLLNRIAHSRSSLTGVSQAARGKEMWRWKKNLTLGSANTSLEVRIERAIARLLDGDWVNQVPAASGLTNAKDGRCSVDIIYRRSAVEFDFIELKALDLAKTPSGEQTPLFASMEVLKYGLLFLFCKKNRDLLFPSSMERRPILNASRVHLEVLMTPNCYLHSANRPLFRIAWLNQLITEGLQEINEQQNLSTTGSGVQFDFSFKQFPGSFVWSDEDHEALLNSTEGSLCWNKLRERIVEAVEMRELALLL